MKSLYSSPLRVYLILGLIGFFGIWQGLKLPISLFPNSSQPKLFVGGDYGKFSRDEFRKQYTNGLESNIKNIATDKVQIEKFQADYYDSNFRMKVTFRWGDNPTTALDEVSKVVDTFKVNLPEENRNSLYTFADNEKSGFFLASFSSSKRNFDNLYEVLDATIGAQFSKVKDAATIEIYNPRKKEIYITLLPERLASLGFLPRDIDNAIAANLASANGGSLVIGSTTMNVNMSSSVKNLADISSSSLTTPSGSVIHLSDIATITSGFKEFGGRIDKTNGTESVLIFAKPKLGGNIKKMSEDITEIIRANMSKLPPDIHYTPLVDPAEFINSAVKNVIKEVALGALLAVLVLFLFIGSIKNVITAAIEIPLSMIMAFILMRYFGININMISLAGLALSAGMNVDASVVVMENIFRHFAAHRDQKLDYGARLNILCQAVNEVKFPVIASTIASLVVFLPLAMTSNLSYAILGDLAKAVVFSHGFSAIVALILVPTVRLHLMSWEKKEAGHVHRAPIEGLLLWLENLYTRTLSFFIKSLFLKIAIYSSLIGLLIALVFLVIPTLPKELVGIPDTDFILFWVSPSRPDSNMKQMEYQMSSLESSFLKNYKGKIVSTYMQIYSNYGWGMLKIGDKHDVTSVISQLEKGYPSTPEVNIGFNRWNPSEMELPDPPDLKIAIYGNDPDERNRVALDLFEALAYDKEKIFPDFSLTPNLFASRSISIKPNVERWSLLNHNNLRTTPTDVMDMVRIASSGRFSQKIVFDKRDTSIYLKYPKKSMQGIADIEALPISYDNKILPLKALAKIEDVTSPLGVHSEDSRDMNVIEARQNHGGKSSVPASIKKALAVVEKVKHENPILTKSGATTTISVEDAAKELNDAIAQLKVAVSWSIVLIFMTMMIQFGSLIEPLLVMVSVPLGFIGVLLSLYLFSSTLSLNSILGVILLNGISVANSIIIVDFTKKQYIAGLAPFEAAVSAARCRLRPILITTLTTVLAMLPISLGLGEGGRILQPLGIAVSGGLWFSMGFTLFIVPSLHVSYLNWSLRRRKVSSAALT